MGVNAKAAIKAQVAQESGTFPEQFAYLSETGPGLKARQIGLVPGTQVPLLAVDLPAALRGHVREQVAERQMRDALAGGGDSIEIRPFHTPGQDRSWTRVLVASAKQLEAWRRMAGPACKAVLPDYLALPVGADIWTLASADQTILARLGPEDGFSATPAVAARLLKDALAAADLAPKAVFSPQPLSPQLETLFNAHSLPVVDSAKALQALGLQPPQVLAHGELQFDLRRDPRAARARLRARVLPWRWPALGALVAAGIWAGTQMLVIRGVEDQTAQYRTATLATVRTDFVTSGPILDIRTQVSRSLAEARVAASGAGESVSPLDLLGLAADVITTQKAQPDYIEYTVTDGLSAVVRVADFAAADDLAAALRAAGLDVAVVESRVSDGDDGVRTELRISAPNTAKDSG